MRLSGRAERHMRTDYHVHTEFSDDSDYPLESVCHDACRLGLDEICITDHVDYGVKVDVSPLDEGGTLFDGSYSSDPSRFPKDIEGNFCVNADYQHYFPAIAAARERWGSAAHDWWGGRLTVRCGLEFGVQTHTADAFQRLFDARQGELDFVLLSCHEIDDKEFWCGDYQSGKDPEKISERYYQEILQSQRLYTDYSCLAHLDAIKRDNPNDQRPFRAYQDLVAEILKRAIADGKGIEVNTSSVRYGLSDWQPERAILKLYRDLGGRIVTVGSDSHKPSHLGSYLSQATDLLRSLGFPGICTFSHMQPELHRF